MAAQSAIALKRAPIKGPKLLQVSVVIRSKGDASRRALLQRAIRSVLNQEGVIAEIIVVLNGERYDPELIERFQRDDRIIWTTLAGPDKPRATAIGRSLVRSNYFSYLDDDDEFLPGALLRRTTILEANPEIDCVATNGEYVFHGERRVYLQNTDKFSEDFVDSLLEGRNWMLSCGATFRASTVTQRFFDNTTRHCEWTLIPFRIASRLKVAFVDEVTCRVHDTVRSQSKTISNVESRSEVFTKMMQWNLNRRHVWKLRRNRIIAFHNACAYHRIAGNFPQAWRLHLRTLSTLYGLRYLPYTLLLLIRSRRTAATILSGLGLRDRIPRRSCRPLKTR